MSVDQLWRLVCKCACLVKVRGVTMCGIAVVLSMLWRWSVQPYHVAYICFWSMNQGPTSVPIVQFLVWFMWGSSKALRSHGSGFFSVAILYHFSPRRRWWLEESIIKLDSASFDDRYSSSWIIGYHPALAQFHAMLEYKSPSQRWACQTSFILLRDYRHLATWTWISIGVRLWKKTSLYDLLFCIIFFDYFYFLCIYTFCIF